MRFLWFFECFGCVGTLGRWMRFFEKSPKGPVSGGSIIWSCASKIAEMDDSDRELFKKSKIFEIGSVEKNLRRPAICEKIEKSVKSWKFIANILGLSQKLSWAIEFLENQQKFFWINFFNFNAIDLIFGLQQGIVICNIGKSAFLKILILKYFLASFLHEEHGFMVQHANSTNWHVFLADFMGKPFKNIF